VPNDPHDPRDVRTHDRHLQAVEGPLFVKCPARGVAVLKLGDYLCPDCELITQDEYVNAVLDRFRNAQQAAHAELMRDLDPVVLLEVGRRARAAAADEPVG
jgi:hypothetical protein